MFAPVIFSQREQEYLLLAIESSLALRQLSDVFLWTQGQFQTLLPHQIMVCLHFDADSGDDDDGADADGGATLLRAECLHALPLAAATRRALLDAEHGLAPRLARLWRGGARLPAMLEAHGHAGAAVLRPAQPELQALGLANALVHGSGPVAGGASVFVLFGLPQRPDPRQAYFLQLLLPHLHLAWQQVCGAAGPGRAGQSGATTAATAAAAATATTLAPPPGRAASAREREILHWVRAGKSNDEVGQILGISGCTVKNHLQRLYKVLGVSNRTHAVARAIDLRLFS